MDKDKLILELEGDIESLNKSWKNAKSRSEKISLTNQKKKLVERLEEIKNG